MLIVGSDARRRLRCALTVMRYEFEQTNWMSSCQLLFSASQQPAAITAVATRKRGVNGSPSSTNDRAAPMKGARA